MTLNTILGQKKEQTQKFLENGARIPVTRIWVKGNVVANVRTQDKNHYSAIQLGFGTRKNATKARRGDTKGASLEQAPNFLKEIRIDKDTDLTVGTMINPLEILTEGDIINVTGVSKGKGYAGVVKRYGFHGGPKTHGQSDRHRAPGSIGPGTTPGRVYKGKRMAGRMGSENVTIRNLVVVGVTENEVLVKGLVPGGINTMVIVKKVGENKKFVPLFSSDAKAMEDKTVEEVSEEPQVSGDAQQSEDERSKDSASLSEIQTTEVEEKIEKGTESNFDSPETEQASVSTESIDLPDAGQVAASSSESSSETELTDSQDKKEDKKEESSDAKAMEDKIENAG